MERRLGRALREMRDRQFYLDLGFVRFGDYTGERLGLSLRTAQELIRVEQALATLPRVADAFEAGRISSAHVRMVSRVATPETESAWIARAVRMSVRIFRNAVAACLEKDLAERESAEPCGGQPLAAEGAGARMKETGRDLPKPCAEDFDLEDERIPLAIRAPVWLLRWWRETVTLAGRLAGSSLPAAAALELVLAEAADVAPIHPAPEAARHRLEPRPERKTRSAIESACVPAGNSTMRSTSSAPASQLPVTGTGGSDNGGRGNVPARGTSISPLSTAPTALSPRDLDSHLADLVTARQRCEVALADHLACARAARSHLVEGYRSLEAYASRRLGLSPRRMYQLLSLSRMLERLGSLRRALLDGRLTLRQALSVGRVASRATVEAWIRRAETITLRRLEDEVTFWELLREERPGVWELLRGGPLPEGIALVPGHEPRLLESGLHRSASSLAPARTGGECSDRSHPVDGDSEAGLHGSASAPSSTCTGGAGNADSEAGLHMSAPDGPVDARRFLTVLSASEARIPLPQRMGTLRMRLEPEIHHRWRGMVRLLRSECDGPLEEWEALALLLRRFWGIWDNRETRRQRRENPTLERDGWRCTTPGCGSVGSGRLHEHHIVFRSAGGALTDPANLTTLCTAHHQHLLHRGYVRCRGTAPDGLRWELGVGGGQEAFMSFVGDRRIGGSALTRPIDVGKEASVIPLRL